MKNTYSVTIGALRDGGMATSSSEDEDEERSDPDYVPK